MKISILILLVFSTTSCMTQSLWVPEGYHVAKHKTNVFGTYKKDKEVVKYKQDPDRWGLIPDLEPERNKPEPRSTWEKVYLTPVTLCADIVTLPIQAFVLDPFGTKRSRKKEEEKRRFEYLDHLREKK